MAVWPSAGPSGRSLSQVVGSGLSACGGLLSQAGRRVKQRVKLFFCNISASVTRMSLHRRSDKISHDSRF